MPVSRTPIKDQTPSPLQRTGFLVPVISTKRSERKNPYSLSQGTRVPAHLFRSGRFGANAAVQKNKGLLQNARTCHFEGACDREIRTFHVIKCEIETDFSLRSK